MNARKTTNDLQGDISRAGHCFFNYWRHSLAVFFLVLGIRLTYSQKLINKSLVRPDVSLITIDVGNCFDLKMNTHKSNAMIVEAIIDGEYRKDVLLNVNEKGSTINVSTVFRPNFEDPNDKLSAHKVISIALKIILPEQKQVQVFGTNCNVELKGNYEHLKVSLDDGRCQLFNVSNIAEITTQSGTITASYKGAKVQAYSKYGTIEKDDIPEGENQYMLRSITGNVVLKKIE